MSYILTNLWPIAAATFAGLGIGALYAAFLRNGRVLPEAGRPTFGLVLLAVLAEFWLGAILAGALILVPSAGPGPWTMALMSAVVIWIGFVVPTLLVTTRFEGLPVSVALGDVAHWLAVMLTQAAILQAIGLAKPA